MAEKTVAIIGARLNSSRLPRKQLLPLAGRPMIAHSVARLKFVRSIDTIVLATTADDYNRDLVQWAEGAGVSVYAHEGVVNDLMGRVDAVVQNTRADILVYVCGDSPLIEPETINNLIEGLKRDPKAGHAELKPLVSGAYIHEGFSVYRRSFWDVMIAASHEPFEREHVGSVYHALGKVKPEKLVYVEDDPAFRQLKHRISVDTQSDYSFMKVLYDAWYEMQPDSTIVDLKWAINRMMADEALVAINRHVHQKKVAEHTGRAVILTEAGPEVGLGHLKRMLVAARQIQDHLGAAVQLEIIGPEMPADWLQHLPHRWHGGPYKEGMIQKILSAQKTDWLLVDAKSPSECLLQDIKGMKGGTTRTILIDHLPEHDCFDAYYIPSFYGAEASKKRLGERLVFGWTAFLLSAPMKRKESFSSQKRLLVLTGGSDAYGLGEIWPDFLLAQTSEHTEITWVQGPFSAPPRVPATASVSRLTVRENVTDLRPLIAEHDFALSVYGVSFFECLHAGLPTVGYVPQQSKMHDEIEALTAEQVALLATDATAAISQVKVLLEDKECAETLRSNLSMLWRQQEKKPPLIKLLQRLANEKAA